MTDFEELFCENRELVFKYLLKLTKNASLSEELSQETFFRAYMNFSSLKDKEKASVWLIKIARNAYFSYYNESKRKAPLNEMVISDVGEDMGAALERKELSRKAMIQLETLEEPYKKVFMLSVFGGMSFKEISRAFGKSESWARVTFYRAKQKLRERMR